MMFANLAERIAKMNQFGMFFSFILPSLAAGAAAGATVMALLVKMMIKKETKARRGSFANAAHSEAELPILKKCA